MSHTHPLGFNQGRYDTRDTDESDRKGIIIVVVHRPQDDRGDLKDVERVEHLIDKKTQQALAFDVDDVLTEKDSSLCSDSLSQSRSHSLDAGPPWVPPITNHRPFTRPRLESESSIPIFCDLEEPQSFLPRRLTTFKVDGHQVFGTAFATGRIGYDIAVYQRYVSPGIGYDY